MKVRQTAALALSMLLLIFAFAACKKESPSISESAQHGSTKDYTEILEAILTKDELGAFGPVTTIDDSSKFLLSMFELTENEMERFAISASLININVFAIAIILPAEGKTQEVQDKLQAYIDMQKAAMENYLENQYIIAKNAKIKVADTGEVVMVMRDDSAAMMSEILNQLKG